MPSALPLSPMYATNWPALTREPRWRLALPVTGEVFAAWPWTGAPPILDTDGDGRLEIPLGASRTIWVGADGEVTLVGPAARTRLWPESR